MTSRPLYRAIAPDPDGRSHLIAINSRPIPAEVQAAFADTAFAVWTGALPDLAVRVATASTGLRLYAVGNEAFLWDVHRIAEAAGLGAGEIFLHPPCDGRRRAQCVHCKTFIEAVTAQTLDCPGCGLPLLVREHFSRRLGAFQAVARHGVTRGEDSRT